ncbi:streptavidin-V2-like [Saccostrea echinata]|uniref:streptavidin-V2-like n=1 Tax=Saccostrea echinata TaxID=191078 RepID=UPI002A80FE0C|nr:streptavidin-V2-like [Saccostrea echinata]
MEIVCYILPVMICAVIPVQPVLMIRNADPALCQTQEMQGLCALSGKWRNQLQSEMMITCKDGTIQGQYNSAVGNAEREYDIAGRYLQVNETEYIVGWSVAYKNQYRDARSIASWTGVFYATEGIIKTQWIRAAFQNPEDYWSTFTTNQDMFNKVQSHPCLNNIRN